MAEHPDPHYRPTEAEPFMNPRQLAYFREKLLRAHADLAHELEQNPAAGPDDSIRVGDQADQASAEVDRETLALNRERARILMNQIDQALVRIENGTYGYCEETGEPIDLKRLEAQPSATLSLQAQERREQTRR